MRLSKEQKIKKLAKPALFSGIKKTPTGIEGFDQITLGGLPKGRTTLIMGEPGSGKTVFALQSLVNGARLYNEPGIFVALEENSRQIINNAATFGWDISFLEKNKLFFLDAKIAPDVVTSGDFELAGMLAGIKAKADRMGAKRIVFDGIDVLLALLNDPSKERSQLYYLQNWLSESGLTSIRARRKSVQIRSVDPVVRRRPAARLRNGRKAGAGAGRGPEVRPTTGKRDFI